MSMHTSKHGPRHVYVTFIFRYFHDSPERLYVLPAQFNYRIDFVADSFVNPYSKQVCIDMGIDMCMGDISRAMTRGPHRSKTQDGGFIRGHD